MSAPPLNVLMKRSSLQSNWVRAIPWLLLGLAFLATRLINAAQLPLFVDEGVYLYNAENILKGDVTRGVGEGKILEGWLIAVPLGLGLQPQLAARLPYALSGVLGLATVCCTALRLFDRGVALVAGILYVVAPYLLFFERLATPDVLLASLGMLSVLLTLEILRRSWQWGAAVGIALVLAALAKSPVGLYFLLVPALALILLPTAHGWRQVARFVAASYVIPLLFLAGAAAVVAYRWRLGLQPVGFGLQEILAKAPSGNPLGERLARNGQLLISWLVSYLTWPLAALLVLSVVGGLVSRTRGLRFLALLAGLWSVIFVAASGWWAPRYVLPALPAAVIIVAWGMVKGLDGAGLWLRARWPRLPATIVPRSLYVAAALGTLLLVAPLDLDIMFHPEAASLPEVDRSQYIEGGPAGYGFPEAGAFLEQQIAHNEGAQIVLVHVSDYARLKAYTAPALQRRLRQVHIVDRQSEDLAGQIALLRAWLTEASTTYVVVGSTTQWTPDWQKAFPAAGLVASFPKPGGKDAVEIRRVPN